MINSPLRENDQLAGRSSQPRSSTTGFSSHIRQSEDHEPSGDAAFLLGPVAQTRLTMTDLGNQLTWALPDNQQVSSCCHQHQGAGLHVQSDSPSTELCSQLYRAVQPALHAARQAQAQAAAQVAAQAAAQATAAEQRRQDIADRTAPLHNLGRKPLDERVSQHRRLTKFLDPQTGRLSIGLMRHVCGYCGAKHFLCEKTGGTHAQPAFSNCCYKGKVQLQPTQHTGARC